MKLMISKMVIENYDFVRTEDSELDKPDFRDFCGRVWKAYVHGYCCSEQDYFINFFNYVFK